MAAIVGSGHGIIRESLPPLVADALAPEAVESIHRKLNAAGDGPSLPVLRRDVWLGAGAVFLAVFASTFPVVIPFLLIEEPRTALRVSNLVALVMLFLAGHTLGRYASHRPWRMGLGMMLVGSALVGATIALGG